MKLESYLHIKGGILVKFKSFLLLILILNLFFAYGCMESETAKNEKLQIAFLSQNCFACHAPNMEQANKIAPAIGEIRVRYRNLISSEMEFILAINKYLTAPGFDTTQNKDWVHQYGNMPKMSFPEKRLEAALSYLYHTEVDSSAWFVANQNLLEDKQLLKTILQENMTPFEIAEQSAHSTKSLLGSNLMSALKNNGELGALEFCNINAQKLTDDQSKNLNLEIKRVSDRPRNKINAASTEEIQLIQMYREKIQNKNKLVPTQIDKTTNFIAYFPIETNESCLKCHGIVGKDIKEGVYLKIKSLYPNDVAVGYKVNEIRGLFRVSMRK